MVTKPKIRKPLPHEFVLEALGSLDYHTKPMFGALAVYVGEKIVLILRDRDSNRDDNGVWIVSSTELHDSLRQDLPSLREIRIFSDGGPTTWQNIPSEGERFEEDALRACELIRRGDPRIGRVPVRKRKAAAQAAVAPKPRAKAPAKKRAAKKKTRRR